MKEPAISWTHKKLKSFELAYKSAVKDGVDIFEFEAHDFVVGYAKYLIEHLKTQLK
jgi:hypothetical protein